MRAAAAGLLALLLAASPAAAQGEGDPRAGRRLAAARCAVCHGYDGMAVHPAAPNLAGQNAFYLAAQLRGFRDGIRQQEEMNLVARDLDDAAIADLAAWFGAIEVTATVPPR